MFWRMFYYTKQVETPLIHQSVVDFFCDSLQCFSRDEIHFPFSGDLEGLVRSSNLYINLSKRERAIPFLPLKLEKAESWKIQNELLCQ